jgi:hypothetical protein
MKISKLYLFLVVLLFPFISNAATLTLSPSTNSVSVNGTFTVNILLDTTGAGTYGVDVNQLRFNPSLLQVVDSDAGTAGVQISAGALMPVTTLNNVDNTLGTVQFSQLANFGSTFTGSGTFATITFRAVSAGTASVTMDFTNGSGTDSNVAGLGSDLLTSVGSGSYTLLALDTTPPTVSGGSPTGTLVFTTTSATMSVTTNENATCRFSTTAGVAYASMGSTFTTTGGTTHSTSLTGLSSGNTYTRYVRCQDGSSNANTSDYVVTFSVASVPDTTAPTISSVVAGSINSTGATITWTTNETSDTQVDYGLTTAYGQSSPLNSTLLTSHAVTLSGLSANTTYNFRVKSRDAAGNLATGANATFSTLSAPDTTAPSVPTGLTVTPVSTSQLNLAWTASTDTAGVGQSVSGVAGYQVWRGGVFIATTTLTSYSNTGLLSNTSYSYQIASFDNAGNVSARNTSVSGTTQNPTPVQRTLTLVLEGTGSTQRNVTGTFQYLDPANGTSLGQSSITTNTSGLVTVTLPLGLPSTINIRPNVTGYLARLINAVDTTSSTVLSFTSSSLPAGDFNGDQIINSLDFSSMNSNWLGSNALTDVNKDGIVNSLDFAYMSNNWLAVGQ